MASPETFRHQYYYSDFPTTPCPPPRLSRIHKLKPSCDVLNFSPPCSTQESEPPPVIPRPATSFSVWNGVDSDTRRHERSRLTPGMTPQERKAAWAAGLGRKVDDSDDTSPTFRIRSNRRKATQVKDRFESLICQEVYAEAPRDSISILIPRSHVLTEANDATGDRQTEVSTPIRHIPGLLPYLTEAHSRAQARFRRRLKQRAKEDLGIFESLCLGPRLSLGEQLGRCVVRSPMMRVFIGLQRLSLGPI